MKKLNKKKIKWIVKEVKRRNMGVWTIAQIQNTTKQHAYRVYNKYKDGREPEFKRCGRKHNLITEQERNTVIKAYKEILASATMIEQYLDELMSILFYGLMSKKKGAKACFPPGHFSVI